MPTHLSISGSTFTHAPAARHYHSDLSIWLSVDPMADKYPGVSPYVYCANNPVRLVDKDGASYRKFEDYEDGSFLGEIDDGVDETVCVTREHYKALRNHYGDFYF